jgi:hypothetical protein
MGLFRHAEGHMRRKLTDIGSWAGLASLGIVIVATGLGLGTANAQTNAQPQIAHAAGNKTPVVTSGTGQYYFEFRSRQAWDYGHTFVVFGRVGEAPSKNNVAGLSPKGDDPQMWLMGHYVPVPSDTGWTDGDLEDKYITSRYRVLVSKEPSLLSGSCRPNRRPGAWSCTTATPSSPTSPTSWVLKYRPQAGFIQKSS